MKTPFKHTKTTINMWETLRPTPCLAAASQHRKFRLARLDSRAIRTWLTLRHTWNILKQGTGANSDPEEFEHCSKWQELKTCISEHFYVEVKISRPQICWYLQEGQPFSFWASGIAVFRPHFFEKKQTPNFLTRDILFEMKLPLSSSASSMLHEMNF